MFLFSINTSLFIILLFVFTLALPILLIRKKELCLLYLLAYLIFLILGVFFDVTINKDFVSFSLFKGESWMNASITMAYLNPLSVLINLFLLFPLGFICSLLIKNKSKFIVKVAIIGLVTSIVIETLQFILPINRFPEVLDVVTNTISSLLGYLYYLLLSKLLLRGESNDKLSKQKNYNKS